MRRSLSDKTGAGGIQDGPGGAPSMPGRHRDPMLHRAQRRRHASRAARRRHPLRHARQDPAPAPRRNWPCAASRQGRFAETTRKTAAHRAASVIEARQGSRDGGSGGGGGGWASGARSGGSGKVVELMQESKENIPYNGRSQRIPARAWCMAAPTAGAGPAAWPCRRWMTPRRPAVATASPSRAACMPWPLPARAGAVVRGLHHAHPMGDTATMPAHRRDTRRHTV